MWMDTTVDGRGHELETEARFGPWHVHNNNVRTDSAGEAQESKGVLHKVYLLGYIV